MVRVLEEEEQLVSEEDSDDDGFQKSPVKKSNKASFQNASKKGKPNVKSKVKSNECHPDVDFSKLNAT
jgi:hypothetical protein